MSRSLIAWSLLWVVGCASSEPVGRGKATGGDSGEAGQGGGSGGTGGPPRPMATGGSDSGGSGGGVAPDASVAVTPDAGAPADAFVPIDLAPIKGACTAMAGTGAASKWVWLEAG